MLSMTVGVRAGSRVEHRDVSASSRLLSAKGVSNAGPGLGLARRVHARQRVRGGFYLARVLSIRARCDESASMPVPDGLGGLQRAR